MSVSLLQSSDDVNEARANIFQALGDPTRLQIFQTIIEAEEPLHVTAICEQTGLAPSLVSHHLKCLRNCLLVTGERDGRKKYYGVARPEAVQILELADECIRQDVESVLGCEIVRDNDSTDS